MELVDSGRFQCLLCGKDFVKKSKAKSHIVVIHRAPNDESMRSTCEICGKTYRHELYMKDHMYRIHKVVRRKRKENPVQDDDEFDSDE